MRLRDQSASIAWSALLLVVASALGCGEEGLPAADAEAVTALLTRGVKDPDPFVRAEALRAIGLAVAPELSPLLVTAMDDEDPMVRSVALVQAARVDPGGMRSEIVVRFRDAKPQESRYLVRHLLAVLPRGPVEDAVIKIGLHSDDATVRRDTFVYGVETRLRDSSTGKREQLSEISRLVDGEDFNLAGRALRVLAQNKRPQRVEDEVRKLTKARTDSDKRKILQRLAFAGVKETEDALRVIARSTSGFTRSDAYLALVSTGDSEAVGEVREAVGSGSTDQKIRILELLPRVRGAQSLDLMRPYRGDARAEVRAAAQYAIARHPMATVEDLRRGIHDSDLAVSSAALLAIHLSHPEELAKEFIRACERKHAKPGALAMALASARYELWLRNEPQSLAGLDATLADLRDTLLPIALGDDPDGRAAAARLVFVGDPTAVAADLETMNDELRYAMVFASARAVSPEDPHGQQEMFRREMGAFLFATRLAAAAGLWRGYTVTSGPTADGDKE